MPPSPPPSPAQPYGGVEAQPVGEGEFLFFPPMSVLFCCPGVYFESISDFGAFSWLRQHLLSKIIAHVLRGSVFFTEKDRGVEGRGREQGFVLYPKRESGD
ncbi:UNVERIFIED_CONTAM: hypothetical protein K2H54_016046 [Gekko kuhli]